MSDQPRWRVVLLGDPRPWGGQASTGDLREALRLLQQESVVGLTPAAARQARAMLSPDERLRAARYADPVLADTFGVAHAVLRGLLGRQLGQDPVTLTFENGRFGRPMLAGGKAGPWFSLSYRPGAVAVALASEPVGIDLECLRPDLDIDGISRRFFTRGECADLDAVDAARRPRRFFELWTRKEALVKAAGVGIDALQAAPALESSVRLHDELGVLRDFRLRGLNAAPAYAMALAWGVARPSPKGA